MKYRRASSGFHVISLEYFHSTLTNSFCQTPSQIVLGFCAHLTNGTIYSPFEFQVNRANRLEDIALSPKDVRGIFSPSGCTVVQSFVKPMRDFEQQPLRFPWTNCAEISGASLTLRPLRPCLVSSCCDRSFRSCSPSGAANQARCASELQTVITRLPVLRLSPDLDRESS